ncbi:MAG: Alkylated repair protein [Rickettsiaceae bacterium]|jgi:alkylated DNA repair dioxygenase AlkB|nr:Alkylated repair protein [Rickettsiaceae bacterium]
MQQLNMFEPADGTPKTEVQILGLKYLPNYISKEEELELLEIIDSKNWLLDLKRRTQHYGYKYDYRNRSIDQSQYLGPLPEWLDALSQRLYFEGIFKVQPDQVIINEYLPGQGIAPHIDCETCFEDTICSLSLGSSCLMEFSKELTKYSLMLEPCSLVILSSDARYKWKHGISARRSDYYNGAKIWRERRVSLTFRKVCAY